MTSAGPPPWLVGHNGRAPSWRGPLTVAAAPRLPVPCPPQLRDSFTPPAVSWRATPTVCCPHIPNAISSPQTSSFPSCCAQDAEGGPAESKPPPHLGPAGTPGMHPSLPQRPHSPRSGPFHLQHLAGALSLRSRAWAPRVPGPHGAGTAAAAPSRMLVVRPQDTQDLGCLRHKLAERPGASASPGS